MPVRLVWAMNVAPPYRVPVWDELACLVDLEVWLLSGNDRNRHWAPPRNRNFTMRILRTLAVRRGEDVHYVLTQPLAHVGPLPDVLILPGWDSPAAWQLLWWAKRRDVRTLGFNESTLESRRFAAGPVDLARRWFFRHVDRTLTVSPGSTAAVLEAGVTSDRVWQVVNAVDVGTIVGATARAPAKVTGAPHVYLFCGQLIPRKRPQLLIEALNRMADDSRLIVAGEGPLADELSDLVAEHGLHSRVEFLGYVDPADLPEVFARCHTLVLPSSREVHGLVVMEALAAGLQAIVSERAGIADVVRGMRGTWVTQPDVQSVTRCMTASRLAWAGPLHDPEARKHSPPVMAAEIQRVVGDLAEHAPR